MSSIVGPENTRYSQRPEPGNGWRHRLERRLLSWPMRHRQRLVRREYARCARGGAELLPQQLRAELRRRGLRPELLASTCRLARGLGYGAADTETALALIRQMAVQCQEPSSQADSIALAAATVAMSGQAVHVIAADADASRELHTAVAPWLGRFELEAGLVEARSGLAQRRRAYRMPVVVVSAQEAIRDYLEDRLQLRHQAGEISRKLARVCDRDLLERARMSGLPFALVVDANRVLIEQACAPMTLAGHSDGVREKAWAETALALARPLQAGLHFSDAGSGNIRLTDAGRFQLERSAQSLPAAWKNRYRCSEAVLQALRALALQPGTHYQVREERLVLLPTSPHEDGLQQLLEAREGLPVSGQVTVRARLTFQRFFRRYQQLAALCSDCRYIRGELWQVYGLPCYELQPGAATLRQRQSPGAAWDEWNQRRKARQQRLSLLALDNQAGSITTFSGRAE